MKISSIVFLIKIKQFIIKIFLNFQKINSYILIYLIFNHLVFIFVYLISNIKRIIKSV